MIHPSKRILRVLPRIIRKGIVTERNVRRKQLDKFLIDGETTDSVMQDPLEDKISDK